jgi:hypothetical protein
MKTRPSGRFGLVLLLVSMVLPLARAQEATAPALTNATPVTLNQATDAVPAVPAELKTNAVAAPAVPPSTNAVTPVALANSTTVSNVPPLIITNAAAAVVAPPATTPREVRVSKAMGDIIRLTGSGVDESVILNYISNSPAMFVLGAEELVYLTDLGVSIPTITAMIQRDQALRVAWTTPANPVPVVETKPEATLESSAPTYQNPPEGEAVAEAPAEPPSDEYFYDSLSPYGTWVDVDGYGRCWRPTVCTTVPNWRPYCDRGRWVYTDSGWYWMSDYSWGSVAFHYGRWFSHPRWGWCWWPNNVWAPSWVTWRYTGDYCGWAPLPPNSIYTPGYGISYYGSSVGVGFSFGIGVGAYTFVSWGNVCNPYPYRYCLPANQCVEPYNKGTVVNHYGGGHGGKVNNLGIPPERVQQHSRTEVRTVKLREEATSNVGLRRERLERDGSTLVVNRPIRPAYGSGSTAAFNPSTASLRTAPGDTASRGMLRPSDQLQLGGNSAAPVAANQSARTAASRTERRGGATVVSLPQPQTQAAAPVAAPQAASAPNPNIIRSTEIKRTPMPARTATPILSKPIVVERPAYTPTTRVVGGLPNQPANGNASRPSRTTSTWTPSNPQVNRPASAPNYTAPGTDNRTRPNSSPQVVSPGTSVYDQRPSYNNRSEDRAARSGGSSFTPSAPIRIDPRPSVNLQTPPARPTYSPAPTMTAPRMESRPAPAPAMTPAPAAPRVESRPSAPSSRPSGGR